jgi:cysteine desulfurase
MGFDEARAGQAIRLSIGPGVTREDVLRFAEAWGRDYARITSRKT